MKSNIKKRVLAVVLCMVLMLSTGISTMADGEVAEPVRSLQQQVLREKQLKEKQLKENRHLQNNLRKHRKRHPLNPAQQKAKTNRLQT